MVQGQTELQPGDVAIIGVNANNTGCGASAEDVISIVFFKDITRNTQFYITDNGYKASTNRWNNSEGVYRLTYSGFPDIPKGTILQFTFPNAIATGGNPGTLNSRLPTAFRNWSVFNAGSNAVNLNSGGDQIYILKSFPTSTNSWNNGTSDGLNATYSGTPLYAFSTKGWTTPSDQSGDTRTQNSDKHPAVDPCYFMNPSSATDYSFYNGEVTPATQIEWIDRIRTQSNWRSATNCGNYNSLYANKFNPINNKLTITDLNVTISASDMCLDDPGNVSLTFNFPTSNSYSLVYTDGTNDYTLNNVQNGVTRTHYVSQNTIFHVESIYEYPNGCPVYPTLTDAFVRILVAPQVDPHYYLCNPAFLEISNINGLQSILANYDVELYYDGNNDGIPDNNNPIRLYLEDIFPFNLYSYLNTYNQANPILSGNYIVRAFWNDKGGFPLNTNSTNGNNAINPAYNGCYAETSTKLTVYKSRAGTLALDPAVSNNTFCYDGTSTTHNITVDGQPYGSFPLFETGYGLDADGNAIDYQGVFVSSNSSVVSVNATTGQITIHGTGSATISFTVNAPNPTDAANPRICNTIPASQITINVQAGPTVSLTGDQNVCVGGTTTFTANHTGGTWTSSDTAIATVDSNGVVTGVAQGSATITYVYSNGSCTSAPATRTVTVSAGGNAGTPIEGPHNWCEQTNINELHLRALMEEVQTGFDWGIWSVNGVDITSWPYTMPAYAAYQQLTFTHTVGTGACAVTSDIVITLVNALNPGTNGTLNYCGDVNQVHTDLLFTALGGNPDPGGTWFNNGDGTYTYRVNTGTSPCLQRNATVTVVNVPMVITGTVTPSACLNDTGAISISVTNAFNAANLTYSWTGPNGFTSNQQNITGLAPGSYTVNVTDSGYNQGHVMDDCVQTATFIVGRDTLAVDFNNMPPSIPHTFCSSDEDYTLPVSFNHPTHGSFSGVWHIGTATGPTTTIIDISAGNQTYVFVPNDACISPETFSIAITVNPSPTSVSIQVPANLCEGQNITLTANVTGSTTGISYQWQYGGTNISGATSATYTINNAAPGQTGNYTVIITDSCDNSTVQDTKTVTIIAQPGTSNIQATSG